MKNTLENEMLDAAISWCDSNGINVLEPEQLASLVNSLYVTVRDSALDTAQPEQPIACMVKGKLLSYKDSLIPEDCFLYLGPQPKQAQPEPVELTDEQITVIGNNHSNWDAAMTFDVWPVFARAILAAAKQAQPERAPLTKDERTLLFADVIGFGDESWQSVNRSDLDHIVEKVEAAHGIKQGGQQ